jgi:hypothetical protein
MCQTIKYLSAYYYVRVLIQAHVGLHHSLARVALSSAYHYICVLISLYICPDTIIYASSYYYMQAHVGLHLTHSAVARRCPNDALDGGGARFTCFTGTKV